VTGLIDTPREWWEPETIYSIQNALLTDVERTSLLSVQPQERFGSGERKLCTQTRKARGWMIMVRENDSIPKEETGLGGTKLSKPSPMTHQTRPGVEGGKRKPKTRPQTSLRRQCRKRRNERVVTL